MPFVPPPPVSFVREIAPVLAMRCNSCHGEAGGLSTRTFADLMAGGNLGKVVIARDAEGSPLIHFLDGRRGAAHRMPLGGRALSTPEIELFRRWINEGARLDSATLPYHEQSRRIELPARVSILSKAGAYVTLRLLDPLDGRVLFERVAVVKSPREQGDAGEPGERISWELRAEPGWPRKVELQLRVEYTTGSPGDFEVRIEGGADI
jgi:hypothetical protein